MPTPVCLSAEIRRIEKDYESVMPPLMQRAGEAAAELAARLASDKTKDVLVLAGPGNNGGDARVVAERLKERFFRVAIATRPSEIPEASFGLVVDGLFGIGLQRDLAGDYARMVEYCNRQTCPVLSLDVPSGLDADTGRVLGCAVRATHTITFIALKPGLVTLDGPDHCGEISVSDLSLDLEDKLSAAGCVADRELFRDRLKARPRNFHKGLAGSVGILGGAKGMAGAALIAGRSALKLGAGRVYVGFLADEYRDADPAAPELMLRHADDVLGLDLDAIVAGPGLGTSERAETLVGAVLASEIACVLDADALNLMSESSDLRKACSRRASETLLTPHPAEAARLLAEHIDDIQKDRLQAAKNLAKHFHAHVVLKGNGSLLATSEGRWYLNTTGNAGMASAGMGDALSGFLGALLAQGYGGEASLVLGTHLHGAAADEAVRCGSGPVGLTATELLDPARKLWNAWLAGR